MGAGFGQASTVIAGSFTSKPCSLQPPCDSGRAATFCPFVLILGVFFGCYLSKCWDRRKTQGICWHHPPFTRVLASWGRYEHCISQCLSVCLWSLPPLVIDTGHSHNPWWFFGFFHIGMFPSILQPILSFWLHSTL